MDLNLHRRQLSASQRAMVATRYATIRNGGDRRSDQSAILRSDRDEQSASEAAARVGVSTRMVEHAKQIVREAPPAVMKFIEERPLTLSGAQDVLEHATETERAEEAAKPIEPVSDLHWPINGGRGRRRNASGQRCWHAVRRITSLPGQSLKSFTSSKPRERTSTK